MGITLKQLYHDLLTLGPHSFSKYISKFKESNPDARLLKTTHQAAKYLSNGGDKMLVKAMFDEPPTKQKKFTTDEIEKKVSDVYRREFLSEIAAQLAGYRPSSTWGGLNVGEPINKEMDYELLMSGDHKNETDALVHVLQVSEEILEKLNGGSYMDKEMLQKKD